MRFFMKRNRMSRILDFGSAFHHHGQCIEGMNQRSGIEGLSMKMGLELLPYPAQKTLIKHLWSASNDILSLGDAFPALASVARLSISTWIFDKIFPEVVKYLGESDALACRLVCRTWMQVVDHFLQNLGLTEPDYREPKKSLSFDSVWSKDAFGLRSCWFEKSHEISAYLDKMGTYSKNPLISRCVQINNICWEDVTRFLERFGSEIWKLRLCTHYDCANVKSTAITRQILTLVPNLKILSMEFNDIETAEIDEAEALEIQQDLQENPFPPLPNLISLDWLFCEEFYNAALPRYSDQLVDLELMDSDGTGFLHYYDSERHGTFPSLKRLVVKINDWKDLLKFDDFTSPLRSVTTICGEKLPMYWYFERFYNFCDTLESINIEYNDEEEEEYLFLRPFPSINYYDGDRDTMEFPKLECVRVENPNPAESFDALLYLSPGPSSVKIQTYTANGEDEHYRNYQRRLFKRMEGEAVEVHGYLGRMQESKIWELMPQLDKFDVKAYNRRHRLINKTYHRSEVMGRRENLVEE